MVSIVQIKVFLFEVLVFLRHPFEIVRGYPISIWEVFLFVEAFKLFVSIIQRVLGKEEVIDG